jgi:hypothetical protein
MARIRTIKPELPHSASMGKVGRESRLCFILMWTLADDVGRLRGNSRMLASLLYPYDNDAKDHIELWLTELSSQKCIEQYTVEGSEYIQICNWLTHQKIDKPSKSKIPYKPDPSRGVAKPRDDSSGDLRKGPEDQGPEDQGSGDQGPEDHGPPASAREIFLACKAEYPEGLHRGDHWLLAEREIGLRLEEGVSPATLIAATRDYAAQQAALGNLGKNEVKRPNNFFASAGPWRGPFPLPKTKADTRFDSNISVLDEFVRAG